MVGCCVQSARMLCTISYRTLRLTGASCNPHHLVRNEPNYATSVTTTTSTVGMGGRGPVNHPCVRQAGAPHRTVTAQARQMSSADGASAGGDDFILSSTITKWEMLRILQTSMQPTGTYPWISVDSRNVPTDHCQPLTPRARPNSCHRRCRRMSSHSCGGNLDG
jgi:hypothetical protein